jgi:hypothetical protein
MVLVALDFNYRRDGGVIDHVEDGAGLGFDPKGNQANTFNNYITR